jgi:hypothetical protein
MAYYQQANQLAFSDSSVFRNVYEPGQRAPFGGIYKCTGCGLEVGIAQHHSLPPQNHHQHGYRSTPIRWQAVTLHG